MGRNSWLLKIRVALNPTSQCLVWNSRAATVFKGETEVRKVRRKRFERDAALLWMLGTPRINEKSMHTEIRHFREVENKDFIKQDPTAVNAAFQDKAATVTRSLHDMAPR